MQVTIPINLTTVLTFVIVILIVYIIMVQVSLHSYRKWVRDNRSNLKV